MELPPTAHAMCSPGIPPDCPANLSHWHCYCHFIDRDIQTERSSHASRVGVWKFDEDSSNSSCRERPWYSLGEQDC